MKGFEYRFEQRKRDIRRSKIATDYSFEAAAASQRRRLTLGQRRSARAHELRRRVPQHSEGSCGAGRRRRISFSSKIWWSTRSSEFRISHTSAPTPDPASTATNHLLLHGQEYHTSYWGHLGLLNLTRNFLLPDYAAYPNTAAASLFPPTQMWLTWRTSKTRWWAMFIPSMQCPIQPRMLR